MLVLIRACFYPGELTGTVPKLNKHREPLIRHGHAVVHHIDNWPYVWHSAIGIAVILVAGVFIFARLERPVLKEI
jgi:hypothetical protein